MKFKREGLKAGVPDICLPVARGAYIGLWIEMKAPGKYPTPEQRAWIEALTKQGHYATCCHGWEEAATLIENYLLVNG